MRKLATLTTLLSLTGVVGTELAQAKRIKIPETHDWYIATQQADRVFPGTRGWLLSCSSGEGGHGRFVWNYGGSGAGGWMQFMQGTFNSYVYKAYREVLKRGFVLVKSSLLSYYEPLGQALTAAYMRYIGISHVHWAPSLDRGCY